MIRVTVVLAVYVKDILLDGSDETDISAMKAYLHKHFMTQDRVHLSAL